MPQISVIICTYNRCEGLENTLRSLYNQETYNAFHYEVIVIDNNSTDCTKEVIKSHIIKFSNKLKYVFEKKLGKPCALNAGIRKAKGEIIAFTDDDVILHKDWLENIKKYFDCYPDISGLAGRVIPKLNCEKPSWLSFNKQFLLKGPLNYYDHGDKSFCLKPGEKPFLGANMALRREVFERHGLFNENIKKLNSRYVIGEDSEYYHYVSKKGEKIMYAPDVIVEHIFDKRRLNKKYIRSWYQHIGISTTLLNNTGDYKKICTIPLWLIKDIADSFIKSMINYIKFNQIKAFYYKTRLYFNLGKAKGYLLYDKYNVSRLDVEAKKMKVAFINTEFLPVPPVEGGAVEEWIQQMAFSLEERFKVYVFSIFHKFLQLHEIKGHIEYFRFKPGILSRILLCSYRLPFKKDNSPLFYFPYSLWSAIKLMKIKPDIIHIHNRPHFVWIIRLLNPKSKIILHIHQLSAMEEGNLWTKKFIENVDFFVGCSRFIADQIKTRFPSTKDKVGVIHNGLEIEKFKPVWLEAQKREKLQKSLGINNHKVILYVGRLAENKGVHLLVDAFRDIVKSGRSDLKLFICGAHGYADRSSTPYIKNLYRLASDIKDKVVFTGYIPHSEISNYYLIAALVVIPSEVEEGFCIITTESLASGIPVIAAKKGGIPEIIKHKETGILIDNLSKDTLKKEILDFLNNKNAYLTYSKKGRQFVESNFTWNKISADLAKLYSNLTKDIKVSVIIPTYNCAQYIAQAIDSVLCQTYNNFEVIVVDDGSTDNTREIVERYMGTRDTRAQGHKTQVRYVYQKNAGQGAARNRGILSSSGELIALLDSDDIWLPNRLEEGVKAIKNAPEVGLVHANTIRVDDLCKPITQVKRNKKYLSGWIFTNLLTRKAHISCPTVLFKRECIEKVGLFDESRKCIGVEDRDLWLRIAKAYKVMHIDKALAYYRMRKTSISRNAKRMLEGKTYVINKFSFNGKNKVLKKRALAEVHKEMADGFLHECKFKDSKEYYRKSITFWPFSIWPWVNFIKALLKVRVRHAS